MFCMGKLLIVAAIAMGVFSFTYGEKKEAHLNTSDIYNATPSKMPETALKKMIYRIATGNR